MFYWRAFGSSALTEEEKGKLGTNNLFCKAPLLCRAWKAMSGFSYRFAFMMLMLMFWLFPSETCPPVPELIFIFRFGIMLFGDTMGFRV